MEKNKRWFYPFVLNDGSQVECWLSPDILPLHYTRKNALEKFLTEKIGIFDTALDLACHQGYFSLILENYGNSIIGIDRHSQSIEDAKFISENIGQGKCQFINSEIEEWDQPADLVLCFGVLYHTENPIGFLRKVCELSKKYLIIETQIISSSVPHIEDGTYKATRDAVGTFALTLDYPDDYLGGVTELAMVPDMNSVKFLLGHLGFKNIEVYCPIKNDYEQFVRNQRIIIYAER
jgi:tRNA (mo5U34)-methyltransferase